MDMVTMNIIDSTMVSICREMGITMMKTSYSTIFNEGLDFTCGLGNTRGELIGVAEFNPSQIGGLPLVLQTSVQEIPHDEIEEGDVIVHNDPYRGGMHTPEHTFIKPVFHRGELMGFAVAIGHVAEVGGMVPGGFAGEATEIFHEGMRVPPVKIKERGEDVVEVWKLLLANYRTPRANYGDFRALISAVDVGAARLTALIEKYGPDTFRRTADDLMDYAESRMRAELSAFRDGVYSFEDYMEDDGIEDRPYRIHVDVHVQGDEVVVDYGGSDPQARGPINAVLSVAWSSAYNAILHLTDPSIPKNSGCFRPIKIVAPAGSMVNANYPATCVGGNTETHIRIAYTIIAALSQCVPERAFATDAGTHSNFLFGTTDPRSGDYVVCYDFTCAAWGGRPFADGNEVINCINGNSRMVPVEVFEVRYPVAGRGIRAAAGHRRSRPLPGRPCAGQGAALRRYRDHRELGLGPSQDAPLGAARRRAGGRRRAPLPGGGQRRLASLHRGLRQDLAQQVRQRHHRAGRPHPPDRAGRRRLRRCRRARPRHDRRRPARGLDHARRRAARLRLRLRRAGIPRDGPARLSRRSAAAPRSAGYPYRLPASPASCRPAGSRRA